jgi:hypothetical protein
MELSGQHEIARAELIQIKTFDLGSVSGADAASRSPPVRRRHGARTGGGAKQFLVRTPSRRARRDRRLVAEDAGAADETIRARRPGQRRAILRPRLAGRDDRDGDARAGDCE